MANALHRLENDYWQVGILPNTGGSIAFGRINHGGTWVDFMRPTPETEYGEAGKCASFCLIPWSNRIRAGLFRLQGREYQLTINSRDGHASHGVGRNHAWQVIAAGEQQVSLSFDSAHPQEVNFPFRFAAQMAFRLDGADFVIETSIANTDSHAFPCGFGHHPYFMRALSSSENTVQLEIPCDQQFRLRDKLAYEAPIRLAEEQIDFRVLRPLEPERYEADTDHVLTGRRGDSPVRFVYRDGTEIHLASDDIFKHVVFYAPKEKPFFAVEPVTNTNDGFNLFEQGVPDTGVFLLQSGESRSGAIRLHILKA